MQKLTLKLLTIAFISLFCCTKLYAQEASSSSFIGAWRLTQLSTDGSGKRIPVPGLVKIFTAEGRFSNLRVTLSGPIVSHYGQFIINDHENYTEVITNEIEGANYALAGKTYKIHYQFSDDKKLLTLTGFVEGKNGAPGLTYTEVWEKMELKTSQPI